MNSITNSDAGQEAPSVDLSGLTIWDINGTRRLPLEGTYQCDSLAEKLISEWIPYWECHKCGRFDYCKFSEPHPANPNRAVDIRCGIATTALTLFIKKTFLILCHSSSGSRQNYLDAAFYYSQFIHSAEIDIGHYIDEEHLDAYEFLGPRRFSILISLRENLNAFAMHMADIPEFESTTPLFLVEGESELAFLEMLKRLQMVWGSRFQEKSYDGCGNRRLKRIESLLSEYKRLGYKIYIQGDADGRASTIFNSLIEKRLVDEDRTFVFEFDFESSIPASMLYKALGHLGSLPAPTEKEFIQAWKERSCSVVKWLHELYGVDLENHKKRLARIIAFILDQTREETLWSEEFRGTELGRFVTFIENAR